MRTERAGASRRRRAEGQEGRVQYGDDRRAGQAVVAAQAGTPRLYSFPRRHGAGLSFSTFLWYNPFFLRNLFFLRYSVLALWSVVERGCRAYAAS